MKGVVVTTDLEVRVEDFEEPLYKTVGAMRLKEPFCMIVNEEGRLHKLPINLVGSFFYGTDFHNEPIVGNIVIMKDGYRNGEPDIVGLDDTEIERVQNSISTLLSKMDPQKGEPT